MGVGNRGQDRDDGRLRDRGRGGRYDLRDDDRAGQPHNELDPYHDDRVVRISNRIIRQGVRLMSLMMVVVILLAILDAAYAIYIRMIEPPHFIVDAGDLLAIFGAALIVLIAIEIYTNVTLYLTKDVIHVKLVVATARRAVARKVITLDDKQLEPLYFFAYAALGLAFGITYWLISRRE